MAQKFQKSQKAHIREEFLHITTSYAIKLQIFLKFYKVAKFSNLLFTYKNDILHKAILSKPHNKLVNIRPCNILTKLLVPTYRVFFTCQAWC